MGTRVLLWVCCVLLMSRAFGTVETALLNFWTWVLASGVCTLPLCPEANVALAAHMRDSAHLPLKSESIWIHAASTGMITTLI